MNEIVQSPAPLVVGLHADVPHEVYHADPCERPSLSASVAKVLLSRSPAHAWSEHPRLGGQRVDKCSESMDRGAVIHSLLLGGGAPVVAVPFPDWRKGEAQKMRDAARAEGKIPVLIHKLREWGEAAAVLREESRLGTLVAEQAVERELVAVWESEGVLCRGRIDCWEPDALTIHDPKTCENARSAARGSSIIDYGRDVQVAAYIEAIETLYPMLAGRVRFRWHFLEVVPPYGAIEAEPTGEMLELGRRKWFRAVDVWGRCLRDNDWPGYAESVWRIEPPGWAMSEDLTAEIEAGEVAQ